MLLHCIGTSMSIHDQQAAGRLLIQIGVVLQDQSGTKLPGWQALQASSASDIPQAHLHCSAAEHLDL